MPVQIGTPRRQFHRLDPDSLQDPGERLAEFCISIVHQVPAAVEEANLREAYVSRHLLHPALVRRRRDSGDTHASGCNSHAREHVVRHQSARRPHFRCEKVDRGQDFHVRTDEFTPAHCASPLRRRCNVVSFQNIGHGLVAHLVAEIPQRARNPPISPGAILRRHLQHQFFDLIARRVTLTGWPIL